MRIPFLFLLLLLAACGPAVAPDEIKVIGIADGDTFTAMKGREKIPCGWRVSTARSGARPSASGPAKPSEIWYSERSFAWKNAARIAMAAFSPSRGWRMGAASMKRCCDLAWPGISNGITRTAAGQRWKRKPASHARGFGPIKIRWRRGNGGVDVGPLFE